MKRLTKTEWIVIGLTIGVFGLITLFYTSIISILFK